MKDIQSEKDDRGIFINKVGVSKLRMPIKVLNQFKKEQTTVAELELSVDLDKNLRGTHMSRFVEVMGDFSVLNSQNVKTLLENLKLKLSANSAYVKMKFPYFIEKQAPVSGISSNLDIDFSLSAKLEHNEFSIQYGLIIPVTTLCPCSKEISKYGAHNQRAFIKLKIETIADLPTEDLVLSIEKYASSPIYTLLKRPDEKFVTEHAYENPSFVEDLAREAYKFLDNAGYEKFSVEVESIESIHNHSAFARIFKNIGEN